MSLTKDTLLAAAIEASLKVVLGHQTTILDFLFDLFQRVPFFRTLPGLYEVLDYRTELELLDTKGRKAVFRKAQNVRFLQNNVIAYYDTAWGDGDIFADYKCSPGRMVDRFQDGYRYNILISLRETKRRGDKATISIERMVKDGFTEPDQVFQTDIDHRTRKLSMNVIFPKTRLPTKILLTQMNKKDMFDLGTEHRETLADGRVRYTWNCGNPALFESYIIRWSW